MKRLGLTFAAVAAFSVTAFAQSVNDSVAPVQKKWDGFINKEKLVSYLELKDNQSEKVADICDYFKAQMKMANKSKKDASAEVRNAVYGNLKLMKQTLSEQQYEKYQKLMALTLQNKGINVENK